MSSRIRLTTQIKVQPHADKQGCCAAPPPRNDCATNRLIHHKLSVGHRDFSVGAELCLRLRAAMLSTVSDFCLFSVGGLNAVFFPSFA